MFFGKKKHHRKKRYEVLWDGVIDVRFSDAQGQFPVKIINFSGRGALLESKQFFLNSYYLIDIRRNPEIKLKVLLPEGIFESQLEISWYTWSVEKNTFQIGVNFINTDKETIRFVDSVINRLHHQHKPASILYRTAMLFSLIFLIPRPELFPLPLGNEKIIKKQDKSEPNS